MGAPSEITEYESQLEEVEELLKASPEDESLLSLKSDLEELLSITRQSLAPVKATPNALEKALEAAVETSVGAAAAASADTAASDDEDALANSTLEFDSTAAATAEPPKKKAKKIKDFEIPQHLIPIDTDTDADRNKKRRAVRALKSKHRAIKKEQESDKKQKTWQSFQKKKKLTDKSMFSTSEDGNAKVGVVSAAGRQMTENGDRKRHKHV
jgi:survival-of-motor-neuron-related-splicing factor 30